MGEWVRCFGSLYDADHVCQTPATQTQVSRGRILKRTRSTGSPLKAASMGRWGLSTWPVSNTIKDSNCDSTSFINTSP